MGRCSPCTLAWRPGRRLSVYTNLDNAWRQYRGGQVVVRTTAAGAVASAGVVHAFADARNDHDGSASNAGVRFWRTTNPNRLINGDTLGFDPTNEAKVLALWSPPRYGWVVSGVYRYLTGGAWGRAFFATGLAQGGEMIRVEPRGTRRLAAINQLDLHIEKTLRLRGQVLSGYADVFNVWNQGVPDSEWPDTGEFEFRAESWRAVPVAPAASGENRAAADLLT